MVEVKPLLQSGPVVMLAMGWRELKGEEYVMERETT